MAPVTVEELASEICAGSVRALSRGLTWVESGGAREEAICEALYPYTGKSQVVGVTGAPGSGKSTLVRALTKTARARGMTVGVIAIDPSSPFSGGSILGDRIRMNDLTTDAGVFIRSMATRGAVGGLCAAAAGAVDLLSAAGRDLVLLETVGVGQDEVDVMHLVHTTVVVSVPGLGDEIQVLKAGITEIADIHVVNKADREGADRTMAELHAVLGMDAAVDRWSPPIIGCVATREERTADVLDAIARHFSYLNTTGEMARRQARIAQSRVLSLAQKLVAETFAHPIDQRQDVAAAAIDRVVKRELSPYRAARALLVQASTAERTSSHV